MTISIIIPSYNSSSTLPQTLSALSKLYEEEKNGSFPILEIIVVDSSDDGQDVPLQQKFNAPYIQWIHLYQKTIPALARNQGIRMARGEMLIFMDADAYPTKEWYKHLIAAWQKQIRVGGGSVRLPQIQNQNALAKSQWWLEFNEFIGGQMRQVSFVPSCNFFCTKELLEKVGGFPDIRAAEDVIVCQELSHLSPIHYIPEARIEHQFRTSPEHVRKNLILLGKYSRIFRERHSKNAWCKGSLPMILSPVLYATKASRILMRIGLQGELKGPRFFLTLVYFFKGLFHWMKGFVWFEKSV